MIKRYRVLRPFAWAGRREIGEVIELADESIPNLNPTYIEEVSDQAEVSTDTEASQDAEVNAEQGSNDADSSNAPSPENQPAEGAEGQASDNSTESNQ